MEVVPYSGETPRVGQAYSKNHHQPYYFQRNERSVWKREGDTTATPRNDIRKERLCKFWASGNCMKGDRCPFSHSWSHGDHVSIIATLQGHNKRGTRIPLRSLKVHKVIVEPRNGAVKVNFNGSSSSRYSMQLIFYAYQFDRGEARNVYERRYCETWCSSPCE